MLKSGAEYLDGLRDGRVVYVGGEKVADVTVHPAFRNAARTVAGLYDLKRDPAHRDSLSYEEDGERHSMYYLLPRNRDDLLKRSRAHKLISDQTYGLFGRSPDHVASFVAGLALQPEVFQPDYRDNLLGYYRRARAADSYIAYAVLPPQGGRDPEFSQRQPGYVSPSLRVVGEDNSGVTLEGIKTLATGGVLADEIWLGNLQPLGPGQEALSITCAVPVAAEGMSLWARKPLELGAESEFDSPLSHRFDETDAVVVCRGVKVPWENVFVHNHVALSREIYIRTPSHCFGNHQSNVRFWSKLRLMLALARRIADVNGTIKIPAVQETLGRLAAYEAAIAAMVHGQCMAHEDLGNGYVSFNRRYMYGALSWCTENYPMLCDTLRELMGGGVFMMPADISVLDQATRGTFESHWSTPGQPALDRMKLFKLAWDLVGSEFGGRHMQYEKFYAGPSFVVRNHSFRECPWGEMAGVLDRLLASYDVPGEYRTA